MNWIHVNVFSWWQITNIVFFMSDDLLDKKKIQKKSLVRGTSMLLEKLHRIFFENVKVLRFSFGGESLP